MPETPSGTSGTFPPKKRGGPLRIPKTAEVVADTIRRKIVQGELPEGSALPSEPQMAEEFGVSRPTLREAFRILEAERLILLTRGSRSGAIVSLPQIEGVSRHASYLLQAREVSVADIYEARLAIEPYIVRKLAQKPTKKAVATLRAEADRLSDLNESGRDREVVVGVAEFHRVLVEVGGNDTLHFMTQMLQDVMEQYQLSHLRDDPSGRDTTSRIGIKSFYKLIDLIEAGDPDAAQRHWQLHLVNSNKHWATTRSLREMLAG
ncbi:FCD domain-containing protein [Altererythrobacter confluentis]|uniref:FCD domain-containing protein n=1 Tax=Allopontixanthobacter confluentis TaxID=1849021 RepID=A0A6L7GBA6_9SPHN|nr:FCD domain-containing protein [Allopontixanthobacter confluentis]MXP13157.1 FCD domain-containing protein [Allopontixanthobacter confluentis]